MTYYVFWCRLDGRNRYLIWRTDLEGDARDVFVVDARQTIVTFDDLESLNDYVARHGIVVTSQSELTLFDFDGVSRWIAAPSARTVDCKLFLDAWNAFLDVWQSVRSHRDDGSTTSCFLATTFPRSRPRVSTTPQLGTNRKSIHSATSWRRGSRCSEATLIATSSIHYCSLVPEYSEALTKAMAELGRQLRAYYPAIGPIGAIPLPPELVDEVPAHLLRNLPGTVTPDEQQHPSLHCMKLLALCGADHPFVEVARRHNPRAHWGIAVPRRFAVAWVDNPYLWWHEALHLFNAKDCYNRFGINKCPERRCIMQASPLAETCGGRLHLCSKNARRIANAVREEGESCLDARLV